MNQFVTLMTFVHVPRCCKLKSNAAIAKYRFALPRKHVMLSSHVTFPSFSTVVSNDAEKQCVRCNNIKPINDFITNHGTNGLKILKQCLHCRDKEVRRAFHRTSTLCGFSSRLLHNSKKGSKEKRSSGKQLIGHHELTTELIMRKFESQKGLGYLSKLPLNHRPFSDWQMWVHRINDHVDYTNGNSVLEALEFNHRVKWTEKKMQQIPQLIQARISYSDLKAQVQNAKQEIQTKKKSPNTRSKSQKIVLNDVLHYKCLHCNMIKNEDEFYVGQRTKCKQCFKQRTNTLAGLISVLVDNARVNQRVMEINVDHVFELLLYQH